MDGTKLNDRKKNEGRINVMLDYAPICCFFFDRNKKILDCNQYALDLFKADSKDKVIGLLITDLAPQYQPNGELSTEYAKRMIDYTMDEGMASTEWAAKTFADDEFIVEVTGISIQYQEEDCVLVYMRDLPKDYVNAAKQAERREAHKRLQTIFDGIPLACHFRDKNNNILECNQACPDFFGLKDKQEYIDRFFDLSPEYQPCGTLSVEKAREKTQEAFEKGWARTEWIHKHKNGDEIPVEVTVVRVRWHNDDHVLAVMRDLREHYKLQEVERSFAQRMQLMLDSSPLVCAIHDMDLNIIEANRVVIDFFELKDKQEYNYNFFELSPEYQPDGRLSSEKARELVKTAAEAGGMSFGWMHQTQSGEPIPCEIVLQPISHYGDKLMISYIRDLREIRQALAMVDHLERLAYTDPLTGAYNRRYFMEKAEEALQSSIRTKQALSFILADIDFFKSVNDNYGHDIGDEVLKILVARMRGTLRNEMVVARYGGEEFVILLQNAGIKAAVDVGWRLQKAITSSNFKVSNELEIAVTASFGVASKNDNCISLANILKNADIALYEAKSSGRNTVISYEEVAAKK